MLRLRFQQANDIETPLSRKFVDIHRSRLKEETEQIVLALFFYQTRSQAISFVYREIFLRFTDSKLRVLCRNDTVALERTLRKLVNVLR